MVEFNESRFRKAIEDLQIAPPKCEDFYLNYYVERQELLTKIRNRIKSATIANGELKVLFSGYQGTGKTTELMYMKKGLEQNNLYTFFLDLEQIRKSVWNNTYFTGILILTISKVIGLGVPQNKIEDLHAVLREFNDLFGGEKNYSAEYKSVGIQEEKVMILLQAFLRNGTTGEDQLDPFNKKLLDMLNEMLSLFDRRFFFIIDGLNELITTNEQIYKFLLKLSQEVRKLKCGLLIVVPNSTFYSEEYFNFDHNSFHIDFILPIFRIFNRDGTINEGERKLMSDIVRHRVKNDVIEEWTINRSAELSGGLISKFLEILRYCLGKAIDQKKPINLEIFNEVAKDSAKRYHRFIAQYVEKLKEISPKNPKYHDIRKDQNEIISDLCLKALLSKEFILEYTDPDDNDNKWFGIHPILKWSTEINVNKGLQ